MTDNRNNSPVPFLDPTTVFTHQDRVIVFPDEIETKTKSGLIIPDDSQEKKKSGVVVLVGDDLPDNIVVGMRVIYSKFGGQNFKFNGVQYDAVRLSEALIFEAQTGATVERNRATMHA